MREDNLTREDLGLKYISDGEQLEAGSSLIFKCRQVEFDLGSRTHIMGVLNTTPDSFYDGGKYTDLDSSLRRAQQMIEEGADIVDIGGESTRPGSSPVSEEEELKRVIPVVKEIVKRFDIPVSVDTTKPEVARQALSEGASIINDISGLTFDAGIAEAAAKYGAGVVLGHTSSRPADMQDNTTYGSLIDDIKRVLKISFRLAEHKGVRPHSIVLDPGFGFGKTADQNLQILKELSSFMDLGKPILIGTSNKSFIGKILDADIGERTMGNAATAAAGIMNGASIIRVHEVKEIKQVCQMIDAILNVTCESY